MSRAIWLTVLLMGCTWGDPPEPRRFDTWRTDTMVWGDTAPQDGDWLDSSPLDTATPWLDSGRPDTADTAMGTDTGDTAPFDDTAPLDDTADTVVVDTAPLDDTADTAPTDTAPLDDTVTP